MFTSHSITIMGTDAEKLQDWADIWRHFCATTSWNNKESGPQGSLHDKRAGCSGTSPSAYLDPWPRLQNLIHMPTTAGDLSLAGGICLSLMHPSYSTLTKWIMGLTLQRSQVGNLRAGHGLHHRRGVTESSGRSSRTNWVRLSMFHGSSQPQRL